MSASKQETDDRGAHAKRVLDELNEWDRMAGLGHPHDPERKSTGESNARIDALKGELAALGARFRWDGEAFVLEGMVEPGLGVELPEATP